MKPSTLNYNGNTVNTWQTITSAKVESGKIKTTSPPFYGVTLAGALFSVSLLSFYIFIPQRQRVVTGLVRKQKTDGTYELVTSGECFIPDLSGESFSITGQIQPNGKFTIGHNHSYIPPNLGVPVKCVSSDEVQGTVAFPWNGTGPGISGFEVRYANIIYPASSIVNLPPQILIQAATLR